MKNILKDFFKRIFKNDDASYTEENGCVYLKYNPNGGLLSEDFRSSGESEEEWKKRIKLKKLKQERKNKLKKLKSWKKKK